MLELAGVCKYYRTPGEVVVALHDVSLAVEPGEVIAVMGPSGSGKSSLLLLAGALLTPDEGVIRFRGRELNAMSEHERASYRRSSVGFIYQDSNLFPGMSALDNVALPLRLNGVGWRDPSGERVRCWSAWSSRTELDFCPGVYPGESASVSRWRARSRSTRPGAGR